MHGYWYVQFTINANHTHHQDQSLVPKVYDELVPRFADRPGGYTRVLKAGFRENDKAPMAYIEFVDNSLPKLTLTPEEFGEHLYENLMFIIDSGIGAATKCEPSKERLIVSCQRLIEIFFSFLSIFSQNHHSSNVVFFPLKVLKVFIAFNFCLASQDG